MREKRRPTLPPISLSLLYLSTLHTRIISTGKMSINHIYSELPEAIWWSHYAMDDSAKTSSTFIASTTITSHHSSAAFTAAPMFTSRSNAAAFDLNNSDDDEHAATAPPQQMERLFEKPLTPSDVGKLNRLVIPKQHAEKHFPLSGAADSGLLQFEDELGKSWRFRYSYWNSSQSYVLTKGWSRFVKEKRLDAGDIVVFSRHSSDAARHFIGWRRRSSAGGGQTAPPLTNGGAAGCGRNRIIYSAHPYPFQQQPIHAGLQRGSGNSKTLRLFGVNLECQADESEPSTPVGSPMSGQGQPHHHAYHYNHMDINFSGADVYRQR